MFRKYALPIRELLSVGELVVWIGALYALFAIKSKQIWNVVLFLYLIVFWYLFSALLSGVDHFSIILGLRPHLTFLAAIIIGYFISTRDSRYAILRYLYSANLFWVLFILVLVIVQIVTGPSSFASTGFFSQDELKIGYFGGAGDELGRLLTRQTGPFTSTGKLGKVSFYLASFLICFALFSSVGKLRALIAIIASLALMLLSGQRAAFLFLVLTLLLLVAVLGVQQRRSMLRGLFLILFSVAAAFTASIFYNSYMVSGLLQRATSVFADVDDRFARNFLEPFNDVFLLGGIVGQGPGSYSMASVYSGGQTLTKSIGGAENSYLTLLAEVGLIGLLLYLALSGYLLSLCAKLVSRARNIASSLLIFSVIVAGMLLSTLAWAITHDAFNSTTSMYMLGFFIGTSTGLISNSGDA
jgi:O-antigen ligase